jgi:predicted metal-dependent enzyme (double-stranded beta helix superfamily)
VIRNFIRGVLFVGCNEAYQFLQNVYYFRWVTLQDIGMDMDQFIADCAAAIADSAPTKAVRETVARAVDDPAALEKILGTPERGGINRIHVSDELTILNVVWAPRMTLKPHNHNMWAVIGVYGGREDNIFWRRIGGDPAGRIEAAGAKSIGQRDVRPLGEDIIHSVTNPTSKLTGAIHVYGGDFFAVHRSEWEPESLEERPYDLEGNIKFFDDANKIMEVM